MSCMLKRGGGLYPRLHIGAVLLAAGEGRRMGGVAKPLIRLQGVPLISRKLVALSGAGVDEDLDGEARDLCAWREICHDADAELASHLCVRGNVNPHGRRRALAGRLGLLRTGLAK